VVHGLGKALILDLDETRWRKFYEVGEARGVRPCGRSEEWLERMRVYASQGVTFDLEEKRASDLLASPLHPGRKRWDGRSVQRLDHCAILGGRPENDR
jgi:hypothetical protein